MKLFKAVVIFTLLGATFSYGVGVGFYGWYPFSKIAAIKNYITFDARSVATITFDSLFGIDNRLTPNEIISKRRDLSQFIIPNSSSDVSVEARSGHQIISTAYYGVQSRGYLFSNATIKNNCLRIYIQGHAQNSSDYELQNLFVSNGCDVLLLSMLGLSLNEGPATFPTRFGAVELTESQAAMHENYSFFFDKKKPILDPLSLFLYPNMRLINHLLEQNNYDDIAVLGISGGGWYTVWLAALMPELQTSLSYAGTLPLAYRIDPEHHGDWEQVYSNLYNKISYLELYQLMLADSEGRQTRKSFLIYNDNDICCFMNPSASNFKSLVDRFDFYPRVIVDRRNGHTMNVALVRSLLENE